jgi:hypothetical protein
LLRKIHTLFQWHWVSFITFYCPYRSFYFDTQTEYRPLWDRPLLMICALKPANLQYQRVNYNSRNCSVQSSYLFSVYLDSKNSVFIFCFHQSHYYLLLCRQKRTTWWYASFRSSFCVDVFFYPFLTNKYVRNGFPVLARTNNYLLCLLYVL